MGGAALLAVALSACGGNSSSFEAPPTGVKVLLVGVDGATFDVLDPLLEAGRLPHFARLVETGARAPLLSLHSTVSPAVWTTIATGFLPGTHGIEDFNLQGEGGSPRLVSSSDRRTLALWNLMGPFRRSVGVVGWWVTWPSEPVNGFLASDRLAFSRYQSWAEGKQDRLLTHPPELLAEIQDEVVDPRDPPLDELLALAPLEPAEVEEMLAAERPILFHWLSVLKFGYCEQRTYEQIALRLLDTRGQPDLMLVFLIAADPISHTFWHFYQPDAFEGVDPGEAARLGGVIPAIYQHDDRALGALIDRIGPETVVMVVSDHGFGPSRKLPRTTTRVRTRVGHTEEIDRPVNVGQSGSHRLEGIFVAAGGPIRPGATPLTPPTVADVAPTVLALLGLPVPRDMEGRVLDELLDPAFLEAHPVRRIDSYEARIERQVIHAREELDQPRLDYLRALGYVE